MQTAATTLTSHPSSGGLVLAPFSILAPSPSSGPFSPIIWLALVLASSLASQALPEPQAWPPCFLEAPPSSAQLLGCPS